VLNGITPRSLNGAVDSVADCQKLLKVFPVSWVVSYMCEDLMPLKSCLVEISKFDEENRATNLLKGNAKEADKNSVLDKFRTQESIFIK